MQSTKLLRASAPLLTKAIRPAAQPVRLAAAATILQTSSYHNSVRNRPRTKQSQQWNTGAALSKVQRRTIFIQTENTPNPDSLKFLPNHRILPPSIKTTFIEYMNPRSTISPPYPSPLAAQLMAIDGVTSVFYGADFITVTKSSDAEWAHIRPEVFSLITEAITSGQNIVNVSERKEGEAGAEAEEEDSLAYNENDSEVVGMIKELLETRIRPAIQEDGGDIEFRGFEDGFVKLKLRGACRTCDSSTVTLKNGIEGMLMHYIEEVKGVHQVLDQEEEIALAEFQKFEEKLRQQKGSVPPTTPGPHGLDSVAG
ncbi:hypothetical protein DL546_001203 [Coniochaeta pulveracea]|uniref:Scaffold protein Nfu/NifU N-terminal domain-containing protein n=1 Tax=Coniochaeta pulveracea TaxID=177199 RepID=A0A420XWU9_9PEZI|nr:hypothetical protein DL546_001203 [Coniochaeta pulveracea]